MTAILATPAGWPSLLLRASADSPTDLDAAVRAGAFEALRRVVTEHGATGTIALLAASGLRGRGGAGYPTADKWRSCATQAATTRYAVANGFESDPALGLARALMETRPFEVVEGLAIAALAVGAEEAIVAVRAEYADAIRAMEAAVAAATDAGFLGPDVLRGGRRVSMTVRPIQGPYMVGEETVLLKALEGRRGQPEQRPPYPSERGLFGKPTIVNNVATLAAVPWIVVHGAEAFAAIGDPDAPGTVLVQVSGSVTDPGIAEVPTGTSLEAIVGLAGGVAGGHALKAFLVGGPTGGLLPAGLAATPYTFAALRAAGAHVGSGSLVVADERACVVDLAKLLVRYAADEACGKTIPCRIGTRRLAEIAARMADGRSRPADLGLATDLASDIVGSALCDHERLATRPLLSGMQYFGPEIEEHVLHARCPAGVCRPTGLAAAGPIGR